MSRRPLHLCTDQELVKMAAKRAKGWSYGPYNEEDYNNTEALNTNASDFRPWSNITSLKSRS